MPIIPSVHDWRVKRKSICEALSLDPKYMEFENWMKKLYLEGLSSVEISELIEQQTGYPYSPRSVQRALKPLGVMREMKVAFRNAIDRGRVVWQLEQEAERQARKPKQLAPGLRWKILKRDNFACVACGSKELLQVDHIQARVREGTDEESNLRTLCITCNNGKRIDERESRGGGFKWKGGKMEEKPAS